MNVPERTFIVGDKVIIEQQRKKSLKEQIEPYLYLIPSLTIFSLFVFYPFLKTIYMSMTLTDAHGQVREFVGFENYITLAKSSEFRNSILTSIKFVFLIAFPTIIISLILALLGNEKVKGSKITTIMFSLPMAVSSASASIIWMLLFHPSIGLINYVLGTNIGWLVDARWALFAVTAVTVWMNLGINFIFIFAGLKNIPDDLIESAEIDGANYMKRLFNIVLPTLSPTLFFVIVINIINSFQAFGQVNIMTKGGPGQSTNVMVFSIYRDAFFNNRFGIASAQSIILFIMMLAVTLVQFKYEKKKVFYK